MESENLSKKNTPSEVGFYTQINNPVDAGHLGSKKAERHSKNMSEFNLPQAFPDSNYYQLSKPKKSFGKSHHISQKKSVNSNNFYSTKKKEILGVKSTHSSMIKRNRQKKQPHIPGKKGNSVALKSQNKFTLSGSVKRNYKQGPPPWKKEKYSRVRTKNKRNQPKQEKRKRRDTAGVQSLKADSKPSQSAYSRDHKGSADMRSMKKIEYSAKQAQKKAKARERQVMGDIYSRKRDHSYLASSEMSEMFEQSVEGGSGQPFKKWEAQRTPENFSGPQSKQDYGSEKMDFFQAKLNEIQSKYISSESYKLK